MDNEWFAFSFVVGGGIMLALDYVSHKGLGKPWLSPGWLQRISLMVLVGTLVLSAVSYTLAQLLSIVDLARNLSAKPQALLSVVPLMLGATVGIWIMHFSSSGMAAGP